MCTIHNNLTIHCPKITGTTMPFLVSPLSQLTNVSNALIWLDHSSEELFREKSDRHTCRCITFWKGATAAEWMPGLSKLVKMYIFWYLQPALMCKIPLLCHGYMWNKIISKLLQAASTSIWNNFAWNYVKIFISEAYCSSWIFSNMSNAAEIILK